MDQKNRNKIEKRREEGTLRSLSHFEGFVDFFSNDYLGAARMTNSIPVKGGTGSRLISGTTENVLLAETSMASFFDAEAALMFNSGYDANVGFFSCVPQRGDTVIYDELIHASVRDGIRMGFANTFAFRHNDVNDLHDKIEKATGAIYVVVESLYSMDGDFAPLEAIATLCQKTNTYLVVDEAHSGGVLGEDGRGLVHQLGMQSAVFARLITFGKAYGSHGACFLGSEELIEYLSNFARSFIYTTALPEAVYVHNAQALKNPSLTEFRTCLIERIAYFRANCAIDGLISDTGSPIQIIEYGNVKKTKEVADRLQTAKIAVKPIYSPTVPVGKERLRVCLHAFNTFGEIDQLIHRLSAE